MKKILSLFFAALLLLSLAGCLSSQGGQVQPSVADTVVSDPLETVGTLPADATDGTQENLLTQPETKPAAPEVKPTQPETKPATGTAAPDKPATEPTKAETEPTEAETEPTQPATEPTEETEPTQPELYIDPDGKYTSKEDVALYLYLYGRLPNNFWTKSQAGKHTAASGKCIGGDRFYNREGLLPAGHTYYECDIDTLGKSSRGRKRIVYSSDGLIYYTSDHYGSFSQYVSPGVWRSVNGWKDAY